jgi:predicted Rossmann fold flavoprotein
MYVLEYTAYKNALVLGRFLFLYKYVTIQSMYTDALQYDLVVLGGGASGLMTAMVALEAGKRVCIIEKNTTIGKKLSITGGGRCNITNALADTRQFLEQYGSAKDMLHSIFALFDTRRTVDFFESRGLPLVVEPRGRMFPKSGKASDVVAFFARGVLGATIYTSTSVESFVVVDDRVVGVEIDTGTVITGSRYVIALGGTSHPETGATGDGYALLKNIGVTCIPATPSIVPLISNTGWVHALAGKTLPDCVLTCHSTTGTKVSIKGAVLCTHTGISGPAVLSHASSVIDMLHEGDVSVTVRLTTAYDEASYDAHLQDVFDKNKNKLLKNCVNEFLPQGTGAVLLQAFGVAGDTPVHSVTRLMRKSIVRGVFALPMTITGHLSMDKAVIADGGVPLTSIDMRTMRLLAYDNLYVTGDMLHIRRPTGGFSLQLCWTTGYVAGSFL